MASQSSQESVTSRRGKVTTIIPERSRVVPRRRLAKRQTTLRAFTFVRDWEVRTSPAALIHGETAHQDDSAPSASSSQSSVTISPSPQIISLATTSSTSKRPRVSPGPIIIASPSSRTRSVVSQKRSMPYPVPSSRPRSTRHGPDGGSETPQSGQSSKADSSLYPTPTGPSATSTPAAEDQVLSNEGALQTLPATDDGSARLSDSHSNTNEARDESMDQADAVPQNDNPSVAAGVDSGSNHSQAVSSSPVIVHQSPSQRTENAPNLRWEVDHSQFVTPGEKSMSFVAKTPKSGPVTRHVASKRRKLSPPPEGDKQQSVLAPGAKKAKIRLWAGNGRRRLATDVTDLDLALSSLEEVTMDYKQKLESASQRRALAKFFHLMKKEMADKIDLAQEYKVLKSALTRMTAMTRKQRKKLLSLQQENSRLNSRIRELKNNAANKTGKALEMNEISMFLGDLQQFHRDCSVAVATGKATNKRDFSSQNIGPLLAEAEGLSKTVYNLRSVNDQLQKWLDTH